MPDQPQPNDDAERKPLLDSISSPADLSDRSDERHGKATYVSVHGLERARELARISHGKARTALAEAEGNTARLGQIADYILTRTT